MRAKRDGTAARGRVLEADGQVRGHRRGRPIGRRGAAAEAVVAAAYRSRSLPSSTADESTNGAGRARHVPRPPAKPTRHGGAVVLASVHSRPVSASVGRGGPRARRGGAYFDAIWRRARPGASLAAARSRADRGCRLFRHRRDAVCGAISGPDCGPDGSPDGCPDGGSHGGPDRRPDCGTDCGSDGRPDCCPDGCT
jgi:hypothetical protein